MSGVGDAPQPASPHHTDTPTKPLGVAGSVFTQDDWRPFHLLRLDRESYVSPILKDHPSALIADGRPTRKRARPSLSYDKTCSPDQSWCDDDPAMYKRPRDGQSPAPRRPFNTYSDAQRRPRANAPPSRPASREPRAPPADNLRNEEARSDEKEKKQEKVVPGLRVFEAEAKNVPVSKADILRFLSSIDNGTFSFEVVGSLSRFSILFRSWKDRDNAFQQMNADPRRVMKDVDGTDMKDISRVVKMGNRKVLLLEALLRDEFPDPTATNPARIPRSARPGSIGHNISGVPALRESTAVVTGERGSLAYRGRATPGQLAPSASGLLRGAETIIPSSRVLASKDRPCTHAKSNTGACLHNGCLAVSAFQQFQRAQEPRFTRAVSTHIMGVGERAKKAEKSAGKAELGSSAQHLKNGPVRKRMHPSSMAISSGLDGYLRGDVGLGLRSRKPKADSRIETKADSDTEDMLKLGTSKDGTRIPRGSDAQPGHRMRRLEKATQKIRKRALEQSASRRNVDYAVTSSKHSSELDSASEDASLEEAAPKEAMHDVALFEKTSPDDATLASATPEGVQGAATATAECALDAELAAALGDFHEGPRRSKRIRHQSLAPPQAPSACDTRARTGSTVRKVAVSKAKKSSKRADSRSAGDVASSGHVELPGVSSPSTIGDNERLTSRESSGLIPRTSSMEDVMDAKTSAISDKDATHPNRNSAASEDVMEISPEDDDDGETCARSAGFLKEQWRKSRASRVPEELERRLSEALKTQNVRQTEAVSKTARSNRQEQRKLRQGLNFASLNAEALAVSSLVARQKKLAFAKSRIHGMGLYACENISTGEFLIEYVGEVVRRVVSEVRECEYTKQGMGDSYLFRLDREFVVDATRKGSKARFINHSCDPNVFAKIITVRGARTIAFYAKRRIRAGDEITYDYKFEREVDEDKLSCFCGAPNCQKTLN